MEFTDKQAIYLQIAETVCDGIVAGKWQTDERIPSVREMAVELLVNPNTVMRAYEYLQAKGIIYTKRGVGLHVAPQALEAIVNGRRENFISIEMPGFFDKLRLMDISFDELRIQYDLYLQNYKDIQS
jgi:DNA-binding transcriptional regulator YhcF (GntR family)